MLQLCLLTRIKVNLLSVIVTDKHKILKISKNTNFRLYFHFVYFELGNDFVYALVL